MLDEETAELTNELQDLVNLINTRVPGSNVNLADLEDQYIAAVGDISSDAASKMTLLDLSTGTDPKYSFEPVPGVLKIEVDATFTTGADWRLTVVVTPKVFGYDLGAIRLADFSRDSKEVTIHPSALVAGADITVGVYGPRNCVTIKVNGWYNVLFTKDSIYHEFNDLFCIS
ncbi:hypothetical protein ACFP1Z_28895 [Streptomyces gamaensis]|uniref:Uncharacterized protein n=1 Tax=Streptomyces gamaensis TaxID=1763542 RepID=A0ABW0Z5T4_9ACTN